MSLVTLAPDGAVLAMIGGRNYNESQFNRATQALRQPGSSFKPFVMLGALEMGYSKDDRLLDAPIEEGDYRPKNYGDKYYGDVTMEDALALSLNTATVRLLDAIGTAKLLDVTRRMGFTQNFKPELATGLGAGETTLLDLTNAYAVIANGGHAIWPYAVLSIEDGEGNVLYRLSPVEPARLFAAHDIAELDSMLVQVVARGTAQSAQLSRGHVAGKTGTSQNYRDAWFVGYTDKLITGVWMGNDDNSPMDRVSGGVYPARLWHNYMEAALDVDAHSYMNGYGFSANSGGDFFSSSAQGFSSLLDRLTGGGVSTPPGKFVGSDKPVYNR
jgi:penicillin-binding protein 1A